MAAIGPQVAAELGDPAKYVWFVSAWIITITICFMIVYVSLSTQKNGDLHIKRGANTDLFGRRWFLVGGNLIWYVLFPPFFAWYSGSRALKTCFESWSALLLQKY